MENRVSNLKYHIIEGLDSGYNWCCIAWFIVTREWLRFKRKATSSDSWSHVGCPLCKAYHTVMESKPKYHVCDYCGWKQLNNPYCNLCCKNKPKRDRHIKLMRDFHVKVRKLGVLFHLQGSAYKDLMENLDDFGIQEDPEKKS